MKRAIALSCLVMLVVAAGCAHHKHATPQAAEENFGVNMAKMNLWREALFRFQRAVQINPNDAMAHNNLAVAYEANGDFENAAREYREAMKLDKSNQYIQKNYSRYVEFTSRNKKRQRIQNVPKTADNAPTTTTTAVPPAVTDTAAPPPPPQAQPPAQPKPPGESR